MKIFTHFSGDLNIDHQITFKAVMTASRPYSKHRIDKIYTFETPSSTEWSFNSFSSFKPNVFIDP